MKAKRKGTRYERKAREELEQDGWLCVRSAGSRGTFDIWALKIRLIQVKAVDEPRSWTSELEQMSEELLDGPGISRELWVWNKGGPWEKLRVEE